MPQINSSTPQVKLEKGRKKSAFGSCPFIIGDVKIDKNSSKEWNRLVAIREKVSTSVK